jgi:hypothetical protein
MDWPAGEVWNLTSTICAAIQKVARGRAIGRRGESRWPGNRSPASSVARTQRRGRRSSRTDSSVSGLIGPSICAACVRSANMRAERRIPTRSAKATEPASIRLPSPMPPPLRGTAELHTEVEADDAGTGVSR